MRRPNLKKLEAEAAAFNARFPVSAEVDYSEVVGMGVPVRYRTRSPAEVLSGHTVVVWLTGQSGCVACSHCLAPAAAPRNGQVATTSQDDPISSPFTLDGSGADSGGVV